MILALLVLVLLGQFHFDDSSYPDKFGVYYSALKGLPSYFNPLWQTLLFMEGIAILALPIFLLFFRKRLRLPVTPWIITLIVSVMGLFLFRSLISHAYPFDDTVDSTHSCFTYIELIIFCSVLADQYCHYYYFTNRKSKA
jgi:drug/metabolite transporter (DMT)-like permease